MSIRACPNPGRALLALLCPLLIVACDEGSRGYPGAATPVAAEAEGSGVSAASEPASSQRAASFEVRFMTMMIDHHAMALEMTEMCMEKAIHGELRALCAEMNAAQAAEIETMQSWLQDWYGISKTPEVKDDGSMGKLMRLEGEEFEIAFMKMLVRHHRTAVKEGLKCLDRAEHRELIGLCDEMVAAQRREIQLMEGWLCQWYGVWCSQAER